jgi:polyhydroxyalkanoate synthesis regulator phasin
MAEHAEGEGSPREPAEHERSLRELAERLLLACLGLLAATKEKAEELVGSADDGPSLSDKASASLAGIVEDLGLVTRERHQELELRLAQLEHRLRLLEEPNRTGTTNRP